MTWTEYWRGYPAYPTSDLGPQLREPDECLSVFEVMAAEFFERLEDEPK